MMADKFDLIVDRIDDLKTDVQIGFARQCKICDQRLEQITGIQNSISTIRAKIYALAIIVTILCGFHGIEIKGLF